MPGIMDGWVEVRSERDRLLCENAVLRDQVARFEARVKELESEVANLRRYVTV